MIKLSQIFQLYFLSFHNNELAQVVELFYQKPWYSSGIVWPDHQKCQLISPLGPDIYIIELGHYWFT